MLVKLLIHSQTSTAAAVEVWEWISNFIPYFMMDVLTYPGWDADPVSLDRIISSMISLQWRHNGRDGVSNHQPHECLLSHLIKRRSKKTSKLRVTGLCAGNSPETGEFPAQRASNAEHVSIWWRHHVPLTRMLRYQEVVVIWEMLPKV